jgi:diguanylate cyclase (GGDEF)-like protein/PAS domain S-box-containing protein
MTSVLELVADGELFRIVAGAGWPEGVVGARLPAERLRNAAWVVANQAPIVIEDLSTETRFAAPTGLVDAGVAAVITVPVEVDGRPWGAVAVHSRVPCSFGADDISFVQSVAHVLAGTAARHEAFTRLRHQALHDPLTGLPNRLLLEDRLADALDRSRHDGAAVSVAVLDVDGFRLLNDTLGSGAGDELLRAVATRLAGTLSPGDCLARLAADEFAVVRNPADGDAAEAIRAALTGPLEIAGRPIVVTVAIGTAECDASCTSGAELLHRALAALHLAKGDGRGRHRRHDAQLEAELASRFDLEADLAHAVSRDELRLAWQPIVDTRSGAITAAEALVRWHHPTRGVVAPADFVPLAEETGLIVPIGTWVLEEACRTVAPWVRWANETGRDFHVSVNLSAIQLAEPGLVDLVERCLRDHDVPPWALRLEITESVLFTERDVSASVLHRLDALGVGLVVDDFGTGFSSLSYLRRFPLQALKVDRSFTASLGEDDANATAIVEAIVSMATALGLETVGEGVEDETQRAELVRLGCTHAQGWLFGRPVSATDFDRVLRRSSAPRRRRLVPAPGLPGVVEAAAVDEGTFRALVEEADDIVACFDHELRHLYVNAATERATGVPRGEMLGRTNAELGMPEETVRQWDAAIRAVFLTGRPLDIEFGFDGPIGPRWYAARLVPDHVGGRVATVSAMVRDVTERRPTALSMGAPPLEPRTGLLARHAFLRLVRPVSHAGAGPFGVVVARFPGTPPAGTAARLAGHLRPGDVAASWRDDEVVVLRHPLHDPVELDALAAVLAGELGAAAVEVRRSRAGTDTVESLLRRTCPADAEDPAA